MGLRHCSPPSRILRRPFDWILCPHRPRSVELIVWRTYLFPSRTSGVYVRAQQTSKSDLFRFPIMAPNRASSSSRSFIGHSWSFLGHSWDLAVHLWAAPEPPVFQALPPVFRALLPVICPPVSGLVLWSQHSHSASYRRNSSLRNRLSFSAVLIAVVGCRYRFGLALPWVFSHYLRTQPPAFSVGLRFE